MSTRVLCPSGCKLKVPSRRVGSVVRCPKCRARIKIPDLPGDAKNLTSVEQLNRLVLKAELIEAAEPVPDLTLESGPTSGAKKPLLDPTEAIPSESGATQDEQVTKPHESVEFTSDVRVAVDAQAQHEPSEYHAVELKLDQFTLSNQAEAVDESAGEPASDAGPSATDIEEQPRPVESRHETSQENESPEQESRQEEPPDEAPAVRGSVDADTESSRESESDSPSARAVDAGKNAEASKRSPETDSPAEPDMILSDVAMAAEDTTAEKASQASAKPQDSAGEDERSFEEKPPGEETPIAAELAESQDNAAEPPGDSEKPAVASASQPDSSISSHSTEKETEAEISEEEEPVVFAGPVIVRPSAVTAAPPPTQQAAPPVQPGHSPPPPPPSAPVATPVASPTAFDSSASVSFAEPSQSPEDEESVGMTADETKQWSAYALSAVIFVTGLFTMAPSVYQLVIHFQSPETEPVLRWVFVLVFLGGIQFLYAVYLAQLPDWSSVWVISFLMLGMTCLDAIVLAGLLIGGAHSPITDALQVPAELRSQAMLWLLILIFAHGLAAYFAGREAIRWKRSYDLYLSAIES